MLEAVRLLEAQCLPVAQYTLVVPEAQYTLAVPEAVRPLEAQYTLVAQVALYSLVAPEAQVAQYTLAARQLGHQ